MPIYELLGEARLSAIVAGFYRRVATDPILEPMYPKGDMAGAEERLRQFLIYRFGGPQTYIEERGHPRLRMRHLPFRIDQAARDRWMELMMAAVDEHDVAPEHRDYLERFLGGIADFMRNA
ncbi:MAG: globin [bacterium]|nr:globin [bacterium]